MAKINRRNRDATTLGLTVDIQWVARRQLLGSTVVAVMIAATACLMAMRPVRAETHRITTIHQPSFATAPISRKNDVRPDAAAGGQRIVQRESSIRDGGRSVFSAFAPALACPNGEAPACRG
jgi:hypothetical protein